MEKTICFVGIALHPAAKKNLEQHFEISDEPGRIADARAALCYGVPEEWTQPGAAENLRALGCHSCGEKQLAWIRERKISLTLADSLWRTVAEHTLALTMAAARNLVPADRAVRNGDWQEEVQIKEQFSGFDFQGKTFGILGLGQVGIQLAEMVRGFRMHTIYYDLRRLPEKQEKELGVSYVNFETLLAQSDYLCILVPLQEDTRGMINRKAFSLMKKGCILVNTARAGIMDEEAFLDALEDGTVAAAGLDVFWEEGCAQPEALTGRDNVVMTPHLGGSTYECDMSLVNGIIKGSGPF